MHVFSAYIMIRIIYGTDTAQSAQRTAHAKNNRSECTVTAGVQVATHFLVVLSGEHVLCRVIDEAKGRGHSLALRRVRTHTYVLYVQRENHVTATMSLHTPVIFDMTAMQEQIAAAAEVAHALHIHAKKMRKSQPQPAHFVPYLLV